MTLASGIPKDGVPRRNKERLLLTRKCQQAVMSSCRGDNFNLAIGSPLPVQCKGEGIDQELARIELDPLLPPWLNNSAPPSPIDPSRR